MTIVNHKPVGMFATEVPPEKQLEVLRRYLGRLAERIEGEIYGLMRRVSPTFQQGRWRIYEVSNGTIYLAPCVEEVNVEIERTSFDGFLSGDGAGLVVSLLGLRNAYRTYGEEEICTAYIRLRDFAIQHDEAAIVLAATD